MRANLITRTCGVYAAILAQTPAAHAGFGNDGLSFAAASVGNELSKEEDRAKGGDEKEAPEEKMAVRFPPHAKVGDLIGRAMLDVDDNTISYLQQDTKKVDGKLQLILPYGKWFGSVWRPIQLQPPLNCRTARSGGSCGPRGNTYRPGSCCEAASTWSAERNLTISLLNRFKLRL